VDSFPLTRRSVASICDAETAAHVGGSFQFIYQGHCVIFERDGAATIRVGEVFVSCGSVFAGALTSDDFRSGTREYPVEPISMGSELVETLRAFLCFRFEGVRKPGGIH
jgi:phosphopantetheine adenylyltransferase